jgi:hypothetical protein
MRCFLLTLSTTIMVSAHSQRAMVGPGRKLWAGVDSLYRKRLGGTVRAITHPADRFRVARDSGANRNNLNKHLKHPHLHGSRPAKAGNSSSPCAGSALCVPVPDIQAPEVLPPRLFLLSRLQVGNRRAQSASIRRRMPGRFAQLVDCLATRGGEELCP